MMKKSLFAGAALLCLGTAANAQDGPMFRRVTKPLHNASLDLQTGTITRGSAVENKGFPAFSTCSSMNNLDHSGFVGVDSGPGTANGPCEWLQAATKSSGKSSFMTTFAFAYCSAAQDPASGGPGGYARIGFRSGYTKGLAANAGGPTGSSEGLFNLSGLPAWTGCSSFFGGFNCFLIGINIGTVPVCLPDGPVAWSYQFRDLGTDGVLAKTFPFLGCVTSCTPFGSVPDGLGMDDTVDQYCPAGSILSSFSFGTSSAGGHYTSVSMDVVEAEALAATVTSVSGGNPVILSGTPAVLGAPWSVSVDCTGAAPTKLAIFRIGFFPITPVPSVWGNILCSFTAGTGLNFFIPHGGGVATLPAGIPKDMVFYSLCFCVQAMCGDTPTGFLSNALIETIGS